MSYAQQAINNLDQTINSFKSRVDVKVSDVSISTASIQATTDKIYENIERFKNDLMHGEESQIAHENILRIDQIIKEQFRNCPRNCGSPAPGIGFPTPLSPSQHGSITTQK